MRIGVRPNVDTSLERLMSSSLMTDADEIGVYDYAVTHPNAEQRVNRFDVLRRLGFFAMRAGNVELGALNEHNPNDLNPFLLNAGRVKRRIGKMLNALYVDETLHKLTNVAKTGETPGEIAKKVAKFYYRAQVDLHADVHAIEPYPALDWSTQIAPFLKALNRRGPLAGFVLDVDFTAIDRNAPRHRWYHRLLGMPDPSIAYHQKVNDDLRDMQRFCRSAEIEFGVIVGSPMIQGWPRHEMGWLQSFKEQWGRLWMIDPDIVWIQSWERASDPDGPRNLPSIATMELAFKWLRDRTKS